MPARFGGAAGRIPPILEHSALIAGAALVGHGGGGLPAVAQEPPVHTGAPVHQDAAVAQLASVAGCGHESGHGINLG